MDVSTSPSLDLACPQAKAEIDNHDHMFRDRGVNKIKYRHEGIMINLCVYGVPPGHVYKGWREEEAGPHRACPSVESY